MSEATVRLYTSLPSYISFIGFSGIILMQICYGMQLSLSFCLSVCLFQIQCSKAYFMNLFINLHNGSHLKHVLMRAQVPVLSHLIPSLVFRSNWFSFRVNYSAYGCSIYKNRTKITAFAGPESLQKNVTNQLCTQDPRDQSGGDGACH